MFDGFINEIKKHKNKYILFMLICIFYIFYRVYYSFIDSLYITSSIAVFIFIISIIIKHNGTLKKPEIYIPIILAIIALQAAWPIFTPRISLESINDEKGYVIQNQKNFIYMMDREVIVKVKPPLYPLYPILDLFSIKIKYPIANYLTKVSYDNTTPNLEISNSGDFKSIQIDVKRVSGWTFDELSGKIIYRSEKPFNIHFTGNNITNVFETKNYEPSVEIFPYDYRARLLFENMENPFPVEIRDLIFTIEKDTEAWNSLKKWTDDGFCTDIRYSEDSDYRSIGTIMKINSEYAIISSDMFNYKNITFQFPIIQLKPYESKSPDIIFKESICQDISSLKFSPYIISGIINMKGSETIGDEKPKYFVLIVENMNTTMANVEFVYPNKSYRYDLANLPRGYNNGNIIKINICKSARDCISSKNITIDNFKDHVEINFDIQ